jgi:predicted regulator of Ras-like GTPase activity (Roadblock/LC7/MglB family)
MFRQVLSSMHEKVEGAIAVSLMGLDGIAIESFNSGDVSVEAIGAEVGSFLKSIQMSTDELNTGDIEQFSLVTSRYVTFFSAMTSEYFILMILSPEGNYGRARYELRRAKFLLQDELI